MLKNNILNTQNTNRSLQFLYYISLPKSNSPATIRPSLYDSFLGESYLVVMK